MPLHPLAGKPVPPSMLTNIPRLVSAYYTERPDPGEASHAVSFGTSGHRGSSLSVSFNEDHVLAITQAICERRIQDGVDGPLFLGMDTHALSEPAHGTALEVLAANGVEVRIAAGGVYTPTPVISHAILCHNRGRQSGLADGIVITPSHNPPADGGLKYNPSSGGPAGGETTGWIAERANQLLGEANAGVMRLPLGASRRAHTTSERDYVTPYVEDLANVVDMDAIRASGLTLGVDALGGSGLGFWQPIAERYGLNITLLNAHPDPTFRFMRLDKDGKIRMDCSSPYAMAGLIDLKDSYDIAFGNDPDYDRHGIVTPSGGLMNPNHYLAVCVWYLFRNREQWPSEAVVGKTLVSSSMIDRVAEHLGRDVREVPVGFKWFVDGLSTGACGFAGEESAGASFLRRDGTVWTTDKDGFILSLLAAEITARTGCDPAEHYAELEEKFGKPGYVREDEPATDAQKQVLRNLKLEDVPASELAGEPITAKLTHAPGNGAPIEGLKVVTENGWFAARPSGTEPIYKVYAESFGGAKHLRRVLDEARSMVKAVFRAAGV